MLIYDKFTIGTPGNQISFNDYTNSSAPAIYRVEQRYPTRRSVVAHDIKLPEVNGIADFQTLIGSESYIISGQMYPNTADESGFHQGRAALRRLADLATEQADPLADFGYVPLAWTELIAGQNIVKQLFVKVLYVDLKESTAQGVVQPFTLYCKIKDPTIYGLTQLQANTGLQGSYQPTGGGTSNYPFAYPVLYGGSSAQISGAMLNIGDTASFPTIQVNGPITNPRVTYVQTGQYIEVDVQLNTTSDTLTISYGSSTSPQIQLNGVSVANSLLGTSTLFKVKPGAASFTLSGSNPGTGSSAIVSIYPAWPLS